MVPAVAQRVVFDDDRFSELGQVALGIGNNPDAGEVLQAVVKAGCWFASRVRNPESFALAGCTVAPGFEFADYEQGRREPLVRAFPAARDLIVALTRYDSRHDSAS